MILLLFFGIFNFDLARAEMKCDVALIEGGKWSTDGKLITSLVLSDQTPKLKIFLEGGPSETESSIILFAELQIRVLPTEMLEQYGEFRIEKKTQNIYPSDTPERRVAFHRVKDRIYRTKCQ